MRRVLTAAAVFVALLISGCGASTRSATSGHAAVTTSPGAAVRPVGSTTPSTTVPAPSRAAGSTVASSTTAAPLPPSGAAELTGTVRRFAAAYARYLDGALPAERVPLVTATARGQLGPVLPASARAGALRVTEVNQLGADPTFLVDLRDHAHTFSVQVRVGVVGSRQVVSTVVPPDIDSVLHSTAQAPRRPRGSAVPEAAARRFLAGYLPWLYGHGRLGAIHDARRSLIAYLKAHAPQIPPTSRGLHVHVAALGMTRALAKWVALVNVTDGQETYQLRVVLVRARGRWLASNVQAVA